jgi:hypothetical protein
MFGRDHPEEVFQNEFYHESLDDSDGPRQYRIGPFERDKSLPEIMLEVDA